MNPARGDGSCTLDKHGTVSCKDHWTSCGFTERSRLVWVQPVPDWKPTKDTDRFCVETRHAPHPSHRSES
jgi:hypothetical protein